ncbi:B3 domain-containing transcription factor ABI3 [Abeliophyllum distichum]|uniref:B3 domain-containing transcription factor ABI3 n=1 Tax=Abeliophyllum distichum TaxID=126358 RepID=A0ABD1Q373_9LAMI
MIKDKELQVEQDLRGGNEVKLEDMMAVMNPNGFEAMEEDHHEVMGSIGEKDLWLDREQENLLDLNDATIFYNDFPPLPDFPCMSSSSSSSSTQAPKKMVTATTSSSSASSASRSDSFAFLKSDAEEETHERGKFKQYKCDKVKPEPTALSSTASMEIPPPPEDAIGEVDCINVMENFGYMDLIDSNEIWDPSTVFQSENPQEYLENQEEAVAPLPLEGSQQVQKKQNQDEENDGFSFLQGNSELAMIFFEWLKQNKDHISAEDMRNIKLKRSTIESASKRLGSNKEGKKQLLKLILEWVEQYQLQKKRMSGGAGCGGGAQSPYQQYQEPVQNPDSDPNPNSNFNYNTTSPNPNVCFSSAPWMAGPPPPVPYAHDSAAVVAAPPTFPPPPPPSSAYSGDPYSNGVPVPVSVNPPMNQVINGIPYPYPQDYNMMEHVQSWPSSQFPISSSQFNPYLENGYIPQGIPQHQAVYNRNPFQIFDTNGERLVRLGSSATKEARKKRMARQRRLYPHHHRHHSHHNQHQNQTNVDQHAVDGAEIGSQGSPSANWVYWSPPQTSSPSTGGMIPSSDASQGHTADRPSSQQQNYQRQASSNRLQQGNWKTEKNLKFLLQKVLKQSDVGNLGRIVLPKKEAESHLPELESRDGISIAMEDIGTSRVWNMRYRFWPNNKSRMYLLENTGDFVRVNGLQEGDFIVIYSDTKCGKYMIRGVKVRQPGLKLEGKKPARRNMRNLCSAGHGSSLAPIKRAVR